MHCFDCVHIEYNQQCHIHDTAETLPIIYVKVCQKNFYKSYCTVCIKSSIALQIEGTETESSKINLNWCVPSSFPNII